MVIGPSRIAMVSLPSCSMPPNICDHLPHAKPRSRPRDPASDVIYVISTQSLHVPMRRRRWVMLSTDSHRPWTPSKYTPPHVRTRRMRTSARTSFNSPSFLKALKHRIRLEPGPQLKARRFTILRKSFLNAQTTHWPEVPDPDGADAIRLDAAQHDRSSFRWKQVIRSNAGSSPTTKMPTGRIFSVKRGVSFPSLLSKACGSNIGRGCVQF